MFRTIVLALITLSLSNSSFAAIQLINKLDLRFARKNSGTAGVFTIGSNSSRRAKVVVKGGVTGETIIAQVVQSSVVLTNANGQTLTASNFQISSYSPFNSKGKIVLRILGDSHLTGTEGPGIYTGKLTLQVAPSLAPTDVKSIDVNIEQPLLSAVKVSRKSKLSLPTLIAGRDQSVTIDTNSANAAEFSSSGESGFNFVAKVKQSSIELTDPSGNAVIVDSFNVVSCGTYDGTGACESIRVGATVHTTSSTPAGSYTGRATLSVLYL